jgi:uncharacterized Zn finger protein
MPKRPARPSPAPRIPPPPRFAPELLRELAGDKVFARGEAYHHAGQVELLSDDGRRVLARVLGSEVYRCELSAADSTIDGSCTCPAYTDNGFCKHLVGVGLAANAAQGDGLSVPDRIGAIRVHLRGLGAEKLADMLIDLGERDPALLDRLDLAATAASGNAAQIAKRLREALRRALGTGRRFIDYREAGDWARGVLDVLDQAEALIGAGQASFALQLAEELFARIGRALESVDDSAGGGMAILERAAEIHLAACRAARPDPLTLARDLFRHEMTDAWGSFAEASDRYAELLGPEGRKLYLELAREAWEERPPGPRRIGAVVVMGEADVRRSKLFRILDRFAERAGDVEERIKLRATDLTHAHDYLRLARFCLSEGRDAEALRWAEDGAWLHDEASSEPLQRFLAERYLAAGRHEDALSTLWRAFERRPSADLFNTMAAARGGVPEAPGRVALADRAVALLEGRLAAATGPGHEWQRAGFATALVEILTVEGRLAAAWQIARERGLPEHAWHRLAEASEAILPDKALAAYGRMVERQVALTNRQGYAAACGLVARMGALRARCGEEAVHEAFIADLLRRHAAKRSFVAMLRDGLRRAAEGHVLGPQPRLGH